MTQFIIRTEEQIMADFIDVTPRQPSPARPLAGSSIVRVGPTISIQNLSTVVNDIDAAAVVAALQIQLDRDWQPIWGTTATLNFKGNIFILLLNRLFLPAHGRYIF